MLEKAPPIRGKSNWWGSAPGRKPDANHVVFV